MRPRVGVAAIKLDAPDGTTITDGEVTLAARIEDAKAKLVITTDGQFRRGAAVSLKEPVDEDLIERWH